MSNSVQPHRWQPTRLRPPQGSPGKNTGAGRHFLLPCMKVKSEKWKWSCLVMSDSSDPMDCSLPGSSVHGIFQARVLEWVAIAFSARILGSSQNLLLFQAHWLLIGVVKLKQDSASLTLDLLAQKRQNEELWATLAIWHLWYNYIQFICYSNTIFEFRPL